MYGIDMLATGLLFIAGPMAIYASFAETRVRWEPIETKKERELERLADDHIVGMLQKREEHASRYRAYWRKKLAAIKRKPVKQHFPADLYQRVDTRLVIAKHQEQKRSANNAVD